MGQQTRPRGMRLGIIEGWDPKWFSSKDSPPCCAEDLMLRDFIKKRLYHAVYSRMESSGWPIRPRSISVPHVPGS